MAMRAHTTMANSERYRCALEAASRRAAASLAYRSRTGIKDLENEPRRKRRGTIENTTQ